MKLSKFFTFFIMSFGLLVMPAWSVIAADAPEDSNEAIISALIEQQDKINTSNTLLAVAGVIVVLSVSFTVLLLHYSAKLRRQNEILTKSYNILRDIYESQQAVAKEKSSENQEKDRLAFEAMDRKVREGQMYLDMEMCRSTIIEETGLNKNRIAQLVQQYAGTNLSGYLNALRIEHAIKLLETNQLYTIEAISEDSGFSSLRTFYRLFKDSTGMSPAEYRDALRAS